MNERGLGRTGLRVSVVSLGTVALGVDYGIRAPGEPARPEKTEAERFIRAAVDRGITFIDTAPAYGDSERLVGEAVGRDRHVIIATKVTPPVTEGSLHSSLRALRRDVLDIVHIHNATRGLIETGGAVEMLVEAQRRGLVRFIGASVYGEDAAAAALESGQVDVLQVAFSVLDQRMARRVFPAAASAGVGLVVRSAFLKGALTPKAQWLPEPLAPLRRAAERARDVLANGSWDELPRAAFRFCLSAPDVTSVLTGAATMAELEASLEAEAAGPFEASVLEEARALAIDDPELVDPSSSKWASVR